MLLSTVTSLMGKAGEKPPKELALGVVARDTRSSSQGSRVRDEPEKVNAER